MEEFPKFSSTLFTYQNEHDSGGVLCVCVLQEENQTPTWCNLLKYQILLGKLGSLYNLIQITTLILNSFLWNYHVEPKLVQLN